MTIPATFVRNLFYLLFVAALIWTGWILFNPPAGETFTPNPDITLFGSESCPHCQDEKAFLRDLSAETGATWNYYEIEKKESRELYDIYRDAFGLNGRSGTPMTFLSAVPGETATVFVGFGEPETTGEGIRNVLASLPPEAVSPDILLEVGIPEVTVINAAACGEETDCEVVSPYSVNIPYVGVIDFATWALPTATVVLGLVDGFNPCAMWVLVVLLTLLIATKDKKKMWLIGGIFIVVSAITYYFFIAAQNVLLNMLGLNFWVLKGIGLLAIGAGLFYLYEFLVVEAGVCSVTDGAQKKKLADRMKLLISPKVMPATLLGVVGLAFSVNLIELACTAGLPVIFNGLLQFWDVPFWGQQGYIGLYILMYMLDDVIVFAIAVKTLQLVGFSGKFSKASNLIGGVLMLFLGILLIYNPSLLSF